MLADLLAQKHLNRNGFAFGIPDKVIQYSQEGGGLPVIACSADGRYATVPVTTQSTRQPISQCPKLVPERAAATEKQKTGPSQTGCSSCCDGLGTIKLVLPALLYFSTGTSAHACRIRSSRHVGCSLARSVSSISLTLEYNRPLQLVLRRTRGVLVNIAWAESPAINGTSVLL
eukprot:6181080-Pleurochrysis_carterae.AAC.2